MTKKISLIISILYILGACIYLVSVIYDYLKNDYSTLKTIVFFLFSIVVTIQLIGGLLLLTNNINGYKITLYISLMKSIAFSCFNFSYLFTTEPVIAIKYDSFEESKITLDFSLYQVMSIISLAPTSFFFTINVFNLAIALYCFYRLKQINRTSLA